jgi:hypothetical protein
VLAMFVVACSPNLIVTNPASGVPSDAPSPSSTESPTATEVGPPADVALETLVAEPGGDTGRWSWERLTVADGALDHLFVTGMGEDAAGELYVMARRQFGPTGRTGFVFRIVPPVS